VGGGGGGWGGGGGGGGGGDIKLPFRMIKAKRTLEPPDRNRGGWGMEKGA